MHRLIERAARAAGGLSYRLRPGCAQRGGRGWTVWRKAPTGWVWNADFATRDEAEDYLVGKLAQLDR